METDNMIVAVVESETTPLLDTMGDDLKVGASNDALLGTGKKITQWVGGGAACLAALATGATMGWTSPASTIVNGAQAKTQGFVVTDNDFSWISGILSIGAIVGALVFGYLVDIVGRKRLIFGLAPVAVIGWALITWAKHVWMYDLGRFITGTTSGAFCIITPMFTSEISEKSIRGALGACFQLLITTGIFLTYVLDYTVSSFLAINIVLLITPIVMGVAMIPFPETPRYHMLKGNRAEAQKSLTFYRGENYNVDKELDTVEASLEEAEKGFKNLHKLLHYAYSIVLFTNVCKVEADRVAQENLAVNAYPKPDAFLYLLYHVGFAQERRLQIPFFTAIRSRAAVRGLTFSLMAMVFQQFSGINAIIFNATSIFSSSGVELDAKLSTVIMGICQILATGASTFLVDRAGRKVLLLVSGGVMSLSSLVLGLYLYLDDQNKLNNVNINWLPILCIIVFIIAFSFGYGPIPWLYMSEVFSPQIKGPAMSIATVVNWTCVFLVTTFFTSLSNSLQLYGTFWLFAAISAVGVVAVFLFFVETKNKTLEEVQDELSGRKMTSSGKVKA